MSVQLVFLVDTDLKDNTESATLLTNSICLSCIRLLSHLSSHIEKNGVTRKSKQNIQKLKWGFKFFNSKTHHTKIESHKLYDFKLKCFEHFENELLKRFQNVDQKTELTSKKFKPVDSLNKAFTDILADFKWETQDFWSPVKGKKFGKENRESGHLVVLFSKCPKNFVQLKEFTGKRVLDEDIFLNSLFPNTLFEQFCKIAKLNLYWIDTQFSNTIGNDTDLHALEIVRKSVEKTGGGVTSLQALGGNGSPYFTNVQGLLELEEEAQIQDETKCQSGQSFQLLPLATVAKAFAFPADNKLQKVQRFQEEKCITIQIGNKTLEILVTAQNSVAHINKSQKKTNSTENGIDGTLLQSDLLHGYAILKKSLLGCRFPVQASYLCSEKIKTDTGKTKNGYVEGLLKKVNQELVTRNCMLVLVCTKTGQLTLMEPLTCHTATLSVLSVDISLSVEKQLLLQATFEQTTTETVQNKQKFVNEMVAKLAGAVHVSKGNDVGGHVEGKSLDGLQMDRYVVPGGCKSVQTLISKLNERISELDFLSSDEVATLKQLSKCYRKAKQPPGLRDTSIVGNTETMIEALDKAVVTQKGKASHVSLSRTDKILSKSKEMVQDNKQKKAVDSTGNKQERDKPELAAHLADFQTEAELNNYLTSTYKRAASGEVTDIDSCTQSMVTVALHYFELKMDKTYAKESCKKLLMETLLVTGNQLREKYGQHEQLPLDQKIAEYETQILLHMEVISTLEDKEKTEEDQDIDEIVSMLRTLSFISEPGFLSKFMQSSLLHNYMHTIPQTLGNIYDELMQPLPESLANILSPEDVSGNQSGLNDESLISEDGLGPPSARTRSHGSVGPQSNQSVKLDTSLNTSRGGRKLVHHYSMVDFGSKRQIVVDKLPVQKTEKNAKKKLKNSAKKRTSEKALKSPYDKKRGGTKLQRRQSVAVMERTHKTPKKNTSSKTAVTPSGRRGRLVAETPCHKQVSSMLNKSLQLQELQMEVIKESPEKACDLSYNHSPTKGKRAKALLRRSFYSAGPTKRTKNLSQYFQLANRIAGRQLKPSPERKKLAKLISFDTPEQFKSPDKNSSFLLSQLGASPSPAKVTPRKFTKTPSKIADSPCHNTRSKCDSPSAGLFGRRSILASPEYNSRQRPGSRKQSPRILAAESGVKKGPGVIQTTPEKSPSVGVVTFGLDSPSQNTRQKHGQTPTRKSVRAALFAKSPATRNHSPFRGTASPRTLLDKFGSPVKSRTVGSPVKSVMDINSPKINKIGSPLRNEQSHSRIGKNSLLSEVSNFSNKLNADKQFNDAKNTTGAKTPSPKVKKVTKTPDSFDKWRRMKPRMSQPSPSLKIQQKTIVTNQENIDFAEDIIFNKSKEAVTENQSKQGKVLNQSMASLTEDQSETNEANQDKGLYRKKRSLLQYPEKSAGSFSKRRRTGHDSFVGSQGFDVTGSFNDLSQKSLDGAIDYFSASNDEVFASQDEDTVDMDVEEYNIENGASRKRHLFTNESENQRSDSPIFGSRSGKGSLSQVFPEDFEIIQKNSRVRRESGNRSPACLLKSPGNKKYSPNVSAKSLMHLIQSPLVKSPEGDISKQSSKLTSPRSKTARSRRSLIMNN